MGDYQVIGTRQPRIDAIPKVTGGTEFIADLTRPSMLFGKALRSPLPHARIVHIDTSRAQRLTGVRAVVAAKDTPPTEYATVGGMGIVDRPVFARERVRFIGETVGAVAAVDWDLVEEALELIKVDYEPLPAVFDPEEAMMPGAPLIHEGVERNIQMHLFREFGDIEQGFAQSSQVSEDTFYPGLQIHCQLEPSACIAEWDSQGRLTIWSGCQGIDMVCAQTAKALNMPSHLVKVFNTYVGGGFGGKGIDPIHPVAAILSRVARRAVKMVNTREEEFVSLGVRHPMKIILKTGVKNDGTILARELKTIVDTGAYDKGARLAMGLGCTKASELYAPPNFKYDGYAVYTNNQTGSGMRGWGGVQVHFAMESQIDMIAEKLGMDPLEIRLRNANQPGHLGASGGKMSSVGLSECLTRSAEAIRWKRRHEAGAQKQKTGMGVASVIHFGGGAKRTKQMLNFSEAYLKVENTGLVNIMIGEPEIGAGSHTTLAMIAAEELGVRLEDVRMTIGDTSSPLSSFVTGANRVTFVTGNAVLEAATLAKAAIFETVSQIFEVDTDDLESRDRKIFVKGSPDRSIPVAQAVMATVARTGAPLVVRGEYVDKISTGADESGYGNCSPCYCFGTQTAEVDVDVETGQVSVLHLVSSMDCGFAINPLALEGQLEGGAAMGMGFALTEHLVREEGRILNPSFHDYGPPTAMDVPSIESIMVEPVEPYGPFGAKGSGEPATVPAAPAIANAIYNAIGIRFSGTPIDQEKVLRAIKKKTQQVLPLEARGGCR